MTKIRNVESTIKGIISDVSLEPEHDIEMNAELTNDLGMDSLDIVDATMKLECEFSISIPDEDAYEWETVQDVYNTIYPLIGMKEMVE